MCKKTCTLSQILYQYEPIVKPGILRKAFWVFKTQLWLSISLCYPHRCSGFKSRPGRTLKTCNFEALKDTAMYFTFLETSNLFLFGQERSRPQLRFEYPKSLSQDTRFHYSLFTSGVYLYLAGCRTQIQKFCRKQKYNNNTTKVSNYTEANRDTPLVKRLQ